jgi:hypothetical protein
MSFRHLTKKQRLLLQKEIWKENAKYSDEFVECDVTKIQNPHGFTPPVKAFRNKRFVCQIFTHEGFTRLSINRTSINENGDYQDGITWDELYQIKNAVGFASSELVELYPKDVDLVNRGNLRHLWLAENLPFVWRNR